MLCCSPINKEKCSVKKAVCIFYSDISTHFRAGIVIQIISIILFESHIHPRLNLIFFQDYKEFF